MTNGCDVASYQGNIDFDLLAQEMQFVISKATEGVGYQDPRFDRNWTETARVGLVRGAYHFARPELGNSADAEATYFLSRLGPLRDEDLLALDYEVSWDGDVVGWCKRFLDLIRQATGKVPFVYLNMALIKQHQWQPVVAAGYPLWLAFYDGDPDAIIATPWPEVTIKQWTSSGSVSGITGRVDLNVWNKEADMDQDQFNRWFDARAKEYGLDQPSIDTLKQHVDYHIHADVPNENQTTIPLHPPVRDAKYSGGSADLRQVFWIYPDGTKHTFVDGKEV